MGHLLQSCLHISRIVKNTQGNRLAFRAFWDHCVVRVVRCSTSWFCKRLWLLMQRLFWNRRFPEVTGEDNLTGFSYSGRVKSPEWRWQRRRADLWHFEIFRHGPIIIYTRLPAGGTYYPICTFPMSGVWSAFLMLFLPFVYKYPSSCPPIYTGPCLKVLTERSPLDFWRSSISRFYDYTGSCQHEKARENSALDFSSVSDAIDWSSFFCFFLSGASDWQQKQQQNCLRFLCCLWWLFLPFFKLFFSFSTF